jgi:AraC family transcriptional regulator
VPSRIVHHTDAVRIGAFRSRPGDHDFADSGPTRGHLLVFPREVVEIEHAGGRPIIAEPNVVMIYNRGQQYSRRALSSAGDRCEWFAYPAHTVIEAHLANGLRADDDERPFGALTHAPSSARSYLLARLAFDSRAGDALIVDELAAILLDELLGRVAGARSSAPARSHVELADAIRRWLGAHHARNASLETIARAHAVSVFHLARVFRRVTGTTIHAYRTQLRLRAALERLGDGADLSTIAHELGFSSHSHFSHAFRRGFGVPPSRWREASKIVTAERGARAR